VGEEVDDDLLAGVGQSAQLLGADLAPEEPARLGGEGTAADAALEGRRLGGHDAGGEGRADRVAELAGPAARAAVHAAVHDDAEADAANQGEHEERLVVAPVPEPGVRGGERVD